MLHRDDLPHPNREQFGLTAFHRDHVLVAATVVTCDPQVGNGIKFVRMLPEDREALEAFLKATQQALASASEEMTQTVSA